MKYVSLNSDTNDRIDMDRVLNYWIEENSDGFLIRFIFDDRDEALMMAFEAEADREKALKTMDEAVGIIKTEAPPMPST